MGIDALAARLAVAPIAQAVTSVTSRTTPDVTAKAAPALAGTAVTSVTAQNAGAPAEGEARARLAGICGHVAADPELIRRLTVADVEACAGLADATLRAYVRALADADLRERGKRPADETAPALCRSCGPVWVHPAVAAVAPMVDAWPRVLGCPWCFVRNRRAIPRPHVTCSDCQHFIRDAINPVAGWGSCSAGVDPDRPTPMAMRECATFRPSG